jgi:hypothetical protein
VIRVPAPPSRWIAALPFGAGQFQNGDVGLGVLFAVSESLFGIASIASVAYVGALVRTTPGRVSDVSSLNQRLEIATTVNRVTFGGFAALAVAGVLEAQVNFGRKPVAVTAGAAPGGALVGLRAAF